MGIYATIPLLSGLINMATNKLAVWMIFSPLNFIGRSHMQSFLIALSLGGANK